MSIPTSLLILGVGATLIATLFMPIPANQRDRERQMIALIVAAFGWMLFGAAATLHIVGP